MRSRVPALLDPALLRIEPGTTPPVAECDARRSPRLAIDELRARHPFGHAERGRALGSGVTGAKEGQRDEQRRPHAPSQTTDLHTTMLRPPGRGGVVFGAIVWCVRSGSVTEPENIDHSEVAAGRRNRAPA